MHAIETRSDCSRCAALCCIAYPSDEMPGFAASKAAGEPCPKLDPGGACAIYERREKEGFSGCIRYECFGAGQHVVQHLFGGRDWRDDPALLTPMVEAFLAMRPVSDLLYLANYAAERIGTEDIPRLTQLAERLTVLAQSRDGLDDAKAIAQAERDLRALFASIPR